MTIYIPQIIKNQIKDTYFSIKSQIYRFFKKKKLIDLLTLVCRYLISVILFWRLIEKIDIVPPNSKHLQFGRFLKNGDYINFMSCLNNVNGIKYLYLNFYFGLCFQETGFLLLMRVTAVTFCVTLAASMAARQGSTTMAAFQVCLQVWLATSLLADGLAVAGQVSVSNSFTIYFLFFLAFTYKILYLD